MVWVLLDVGDGGGDHCGNTGFHVGSTPGVERLVDYGWGEGVGTPAFEGAGGDDIDVTGETDIGLGLSAVGGVEGAEVVVGEDLGLEPSGFEGGFKEVDASRVARGEAGDIEERLEYSECH